MTDRTTKQAIEFKLNQLAARTVDVPQNFTEAVTMSNAAVIMSAIPTSDPSVAGQLWANAGVLTISAG